MYNYIGHPSQLYGIEEHRLCGGKGDGMRLLEVNNGGGLMFCVSPDRCGDLSRLYYKGSNLGFFAPCGYVAPQYYDNQGSGFLRSFTAGFLTTCGLTAVGSPCVDDGEQLPLHGNISHVPAENISYRSDQDQLYIRLVMRDASLFGHKLVLVREYTCTPFENTITIHDTVENIDTKPTPYMILYHFNIGYPLLTEKSVLTIPNKGVTPRDAHAAEGMDACLYMEKPQAGFIEQCYYYDLTDGTAEIYNPDLNLGLSLQFNSEELPCFTQWKMMGAGEYVLGLEPGNCTPDGRDVLRKNGTLRFLAPGEKAEQTIGIKIREE